MQYDDRDIALLVAKLMSVKQIEYIVVVDKIKTRDKMNYRNNNEQWKEQGKCNVCRREKYCSKPCKAYKERAEYELKCLIARKMFLKNEEVSG